MNRPTYYLVDLIATEVPGTLYEGRTGHIFSWRPAYQSMNKGEKWIGTIRVKKIFINGPFHHDRTVYRTAEQVYKGFKKGALKFRGKPDKSLVEELDLIAKEPPK